MILMNDLIPTTKLVKVILEQDKRARNSDNYLYYKVIEYVAEARGLNTRNINIRDFWLRWYWMFPNVETVRRSRQKIQRLYPELRASQRTKVLRAEQERAFRAYARKAGL